MAKFGEWTLCKDELPKVDGIFGEYRTVIVTTVRETFPAIYEKTRVRGKVVYRWRYVWDRIYDGPEIIAWMPLPEPYRGD